MTPTRSLHPDLPFAEIPDGASVLARLLADPRRGREELRRLISTHGLVVFRSAAGLSPAEEVKVIRMFGYHAERDESSLGAFGGWSSRPSGIATLPAQPDVLCQGNVRLENHHGIESLQLKQLLSLENEGFHS